MDQAAILDPPAAMDPPEAIAAVTALPTIPAFNPVNPTGWFACAEVYLASKRITKPIDKFFAIINAIPFTEQYIFQDILEAYLTLPDPVASLKARLCQAFVKSPFQACSELIDHGPLGSEKPSALMAKMITLLPKGEPQGHLFTTLFLRRMPLEVRQHLSTQKYPNCLEMSIAADAIMSYSQNQVIAAADFSRSRPRSPSPAPRRRAQTPGRRTYQDGHELCFYHFTYGSKAQKCKAPCTFKAKN